MGSTSSKKAPAKPNHLGYNLPPGWRPGNFIPGYHAPLRGFLLPGMTMSTLKKNTPLIPLFMAVGAGCVGAGVYLLRLAIRNPDVSWRGETEEPWNTLAPTHQYKLYSPTRDYSKLKPDPDRPDISDWKRPKHDSSNQPIVEE